MRREVLRGPTETRRDLSTLGSRGTESPCPSKFLGIPQKLIGASPVYNKDFGSGTGSPTLSHTDPDPVDGVDLESNPHFCRGTVGILQSS